MSAPIVVSLCDKTGNMVREWAEAGCECLCFDMQHSIRADRTERVGAGSITYRWGDVRSLTPSDLGTPAIVFAFPPCTHLAVSGARDFKRKGMRLLIDALELVESCRLLCEFSGSPWMLENPVGTLSTYWREPDHTFDPCDYGDPYTKKTCLWTGGGFVMPLRRKAGEINLFGDEGHLRVEPTMGSAIHSHPAFSNPDPDRANRRSATPMGFARAVFAANYPGVKARAA